MGAVSSRERRGSSLGCWSSKSSTRHHEDGDEDQYAPAKPSKLRLEVRGESRATTTTSCYDLPTPVSDDSDSPPLALSSNERLLQIIRCFPFPSPRSSPRESPRLRRKEVNENEAKQRRSHSLERNGDDGRFRHVMGQLVQVSVETMAITALPKESIDCWLKERLKNWFQLSGHEGSIVPASSNSLYKKQTGLCTEGRAYQLIHEEPLLSPFAPKFYQQIEKNCETFIEIEDLLSHFSKPAATTIMDVKIGTRTFLESEVNNPVLREQLYEKMIKIDPFEPTEEEREQRAITKLRYMQYRETQSSTATLGFRIEAAKMPGGTTEKEFKKVHTAEDVEGVFKTFLGDDRKRVAAGLLKRLQGLRTAVEASRFFASHEVVGSSLLLMFDNDRVGVWMIDFAKAVKHCSGLSLTHRAEWVQGNGEDGYLTGIDNLIQIFERLVAECH